MGIKQKKGKGKESGLV